MYTSHESFLLVLNHDTIWSVKLPHSCQRTTVIPQVKCTVCYTILQRFKKLHKIDMADMRGAAEAMLASTEHHRRFLFERRRRVVDFDVEG